MSGSSSSYTYFNDLTDKKERIEQEKLLMNKKIKKWKKVWRWWHYTKIYTLFFMWFFLPFSIVVSTFYFYPLYTMSIPSVIMVLLLLIILACNASPQGWKTIYKWIGTLVQTMIGVCYVIYFMLFDQMSSYDMNDPTERQMF